MRCTIPLLLLTATAYAGEAAPPAWKDPLHELLGNAADYVLTIVAAWLIGQVSLALHRLLTKLGWQLDTAQEVKLKEAITEAVHAVEERAARGLVAKGEAKTAEAIRLVQAKVPGVSDAVIRLGIDAALSMWPRLGATSIVERQPTIADVAQYILKPNNTTGAKP